MGEFCIIYRGALYYAHVSLLWFIVVGLALFVISKWTTVDYSGVCNTRCVFGNKDNRLLSLGITHGFPVKSWDLDFVVQSANVCSVVLRCTTLKAQKSNFEIHLRKSEMITLNIDVTTKRIFFKNHF